MEDWILLLGGIVLILITLLALLTHSGLFANVDVKTGNPPIGKCFIAYKDGTGAYSAVGSTFSESTSIAPNLKQIGIYYDDPAEVAEPNLRWAVGAILAENDEVVDETIRQAYEKEKYKFMTLPQIPTSVNCTFPYVTMISIFIAVKRVYPRLASYIQTRRLEAYPFMEIYFGGYINFVAPLSSQMDFYSPKARESEPKQEDLADIKEPKLGPEVAEKIRESQMERPALVAEPRQTAVEQEVEEPAMKGVQERKLEQAVEERKLEQAVEEPKLEQEVEEPKLEQEVEEPKLEQEVEELKLEQKVEEPKLEKDAEEPIFDQVVKDLTPETETKGPIGLSEDKDVESEPDSDSSFEKVEAED